MVPDPFTVLLNLICSVLLRIFASMYIRGITYSFLFFFWRGNCVFLMKNILNNHKEMKTSSVTRANVLEVFAAKA